MVQLVKVRSVLNRHKRRDRWFLDDYSVNPYEGCSINCIYCYIRGSKYGENMAETLVAKANAPEVLDRQLMRRAQREEHGIIAVSSATDAYMPIEAELRLTRRLLEVILKHRFPVHVITKSPLVQRDFDLLTTIDRVAILPVDLRESLGRGVIISFSISTLAEARARLFEPGASSPKERLQALTRCKEAGFLAGVNCIPTLPFLSDTEPELDQMIGAARQHGADFVLVGGLTLFGSGPADSKTLYHRALQKHFPDLVPKYRRVYRIFPMPSKKYQEELQERARQVCVRYGIRPSIV